MAMQSGFIKRIRDIMRMDAGINGDAQRIEQMVWMLNSLGITVDTCVHTHYISNSFYKT